MRTIEQRDHPVIRPLEEVTVRDLMHTGVFHCPPETPLKVVARIMSLNKIHSVVVFGDPANYNDERAWRIVSDVDLVGLALSGSVSRTAGDAATGEVLTVVPSDLIAHAAKVMSGNGTSHVVVVDEASNHPVGVLSTLDIAAALAWSPSISSKV